jgi:hypothetical protein
LGDVAHVAAGVSYGVSVRKVAERVAAVSRRYRRWTVPV